MTPTTFTDKVANDGTESDKATDTVPENDKDGTDKESSSSEVSFTHPAKGGGPPSGTRMAGMDVRLAGPIWSQHP